MTSVKLRPTYIAGKTYPVWQGNTCKEIDGKIMQAAQAIDERNTYTSMHRYSPLDRIQRIEQSLSRAGILLDWNEL